MQIQSGWVDSFLSNRLFGQQTNKQYIFDILLGQEKMEQITWDQKEQSTGY